MTKFIAIASGKGGVGKTTVALNLASAMRMLKHNVIALDANIATPNMSLYLGATVLEVSLNDVLKGKTPITDVAYMHHSGLKIIPASISIKDMKNISLENFKQILHGLDGFAETVIVDTAPGLNRETMDVMRAVDEIVVITTPEIPAVTDAMKTTRMAEEIGCQVVGVIVNRVKKDHLDMSSENISSMIDKEIIGIIPEDDVIRKAIAKKEPAVYAFPKAKSSKAFMEIAKRILKEE